MRVAASLSRPRQMTWLLLPQAAHGACCCRSYLLFTAPPSHLAPHPTSTCNIEKVIDLNSSWEFHLLSYLPSGVPICKCKACGLCLCNFHLSLFALQADPAHNQKRFEPLQAVFQWLSAADGIARLTANLSDFNSVSTFATTLTLTDRVTFSLTAILDHNFNSSHGQEG